MAKINRLIPLENVIEGENRTPKQFDCKGQTFQVNDGWPVFVDQEIGMYEYKVRIRKEWRILYCDTKLEGTFWYILPK